MSRPAVTAVAVAVLILVSVIIITLARLSPRVSRRLLRGAALRCFHTDAQRERFEEEWLADLDDVPGTLAKLAHTLGVLLFAATPLWARSRWRRSRLAGWMDRAAARPRPWLVAIDAGGAALARAGAVALALAVTGLVAVHPVESALGLGQARQAPSAAPAKFVSRPIPPPFPSRPFAPDVDMALMLRPLDYMQGKNASGQYAGLQFRPTGRAAGWPDFIAATAGFPLGARCKLYAISKDGKRYLLSTWTTDSHQGTSNSWAGISWDHYMTAQIGETALTAPEIKSFEVSSAQTPPVFINTHY